MLVATLDTTAQSTLSEAILSLLTNFYALSTIAMQPTVASDCPQLPQILEREFCLGGQAPSLHARLQRQFGTATHTNRLCGRPVSTEAF